MSTVQFQSYRHYRQHSSGLELVSDSLGTARRPAIASGAGRGMSPWNHSQRNFARRTTLPLASEQLWRIEEGVVRTLAHSADEEAVMALGFWGVGSVVGLPLAGDVALQVECLTRVKASLVSTAVLEDPQILLAHLQQQNRLMAILRRGRVGDRLQAFLQWFAQEFGYGSPEGLVVPPLLTHQEIAETLQCSRVTVTRLLNTAVKKGTILRSHGELIIPNG